MAAYQASLEASASKAAAPKQCYSTILAASPADTAISPCGVSKLRRHSPLAALADGAAIPFATLAVGAAISLCSTSRLRRHFPLRRWQLVPPFPLRRWQLVPPYPLRRWQIAPPYPSRSVSSWCRYFPFSKRKKKRPFARKQKTFIKILFVVSPKPLLRIYLSLT